MAKDDGMTWTVTVVPGRAKRGEKGLYLRGRKRVDGKRIEARSAAGTDDPAQAELERQRFLADLNGGALGLTVLECMDRRIADLAVDPNKSPHSVKSFRCARTIFSEFLDVREVDGPLLKRVRVALRDRGMGNGTINTYLSRAAASWRWCEELGYVKGGWPRVRALPKPPRKKRPYTPEEVESVLGWVRSWQDGRWYLIVLLIAETGRRVFEVCGLQRRDVDLAERVIRVRLKGRAPLVIPLSDEAAELLRPLLVDRKPEAWVFQRKKRGGGFQAQPTKSVLEVVRRAIVELGIPDGERLDVHSLRRAFAFDADQAGLSDEDAMRLTGHETPAMLHHYRRGGVGKSTREAFEKVVRYRAARAGRAAPPPAPSPQPPPESQIPGASTHDNERLCGAGGDPVQDRSAGLHLTRPLDLGLAGRGEEVATSQHDPVQPSPRFREVHHALLTRACDLADADPELFYALGGPLWSEVLGGLAKLGEERAAELLAARRRERQA